MLEEGEMQGYLIKLGAKVKSWKRRFFVLSQGHLLYYESSEKFHRGKRGNRKSAAKGAISVIKSKIRQLPKSETKRDHSFSIRPFNSKRRYMLVCHNAAIMQDWINALVEQGAILDVTVFKTQSTVWTMEELNSMLESESKRAVKIKDGYLVQHDGPRAQERYVVLTDAHLLTYNKKTDFKSLQDTDNARTIISLAGSRVMQGQTEKVLSLWPLHSGKLIELEATKVEVRDAWMTAFSEAGAELQTTAEAGKLRHQLLAQTKENRVEVADLGVDFEGYLTKMGGIRKNWLTRYFVMRRGYLMYFADQFSLSAAKSVFPMKNATVTQLEPMHFGKKYSFGITPPGKKRMYVMEATSHNERLDWITAALANGAIAAEGAEALDLKAIEEAIAEDFIPIEPAEEEEKVVVEEPPDSLVGKLLASIAAEVSQDAAGPSNFSSTKAILEDAIKQACVAPPARRDSDGLLVAAPPPGKVKLDNVPVLILVMLTLKEPEQQARVFQKLIEAGADMDAPADHIEYEWKDVETMVKHNYEFKEVCALHVALVLDGDEVRGANLPMLLLQAGANPNLIAGMCRRNGILCEGCPPLPLAVSMNAARWMGPLVKFSASPNVPAQRITERFTQRTRRGAGLYKKNCYEEVTVMHLAIARGDINMARMLVHGGAALEAEARLISIDQTFPGPRLEVQMTQIQIIAMCEVFPNRMALKDAILGEYDRDAVGLSSPSGTDHNPRCNSPTSSTSVPDLPLPPIPDASLEGEAAAEVED